MTAENLLKDSFKLSLYEARVYLALLKGSMAPRQISVVSQVPLPRIYDTLRSLQVKGFIEESGERFSAISPRAALEGRKSQFELAFSKEQRERGKVTRDLVKMLEPSPNRVSTHSQDIVLLRGINAIASKFREIISESKEIILVVKKAIGAKELFKPYLEKGTTAKAKTVRILLPRAVKLTEEDRDFVSKSGIRVKQTENLFLDLMVADDEVVMIGVPDPLSEEPYHSMAVMIVSRSFARSVRDSLNEIWRKS